MGGVIIAICICCLTLPVDDSLLFFPFLGEFVQTQQKSARCSSTFSQTYQQGHSGFNSLSKMSRTYQVIIDSLTFTSLSVDSPPFDGSSERCSIPSQGGKR